jgi:hypothetical protein
VIIKNPFLLDLPNFKVSTIIPKINFILIGRSARFLSDVISAP